MFVYVHVIVCAGGRVAVCGCRWMRECVYGGCMWRWVRVCRSGRMSVFVRVCVCVCDFVFSKFYLLAPRFSRQCVDPRALCDPTAPRVEAPPGTRLLLTELTCSLCGLQEGGQDAQACSQVLSHPLGRVIRQVSGLPHAVLCWHPDPSAPGLSWHEGLLTRVPPLGAPPARAVSLPGPSCAPRFYQGHTCVPGGSLLPHRPHS